MVELLEKAEREEDKIVRVALCYNAFDLSDPIREELVFQEGKVLTHYIEGLPDSCEWKVGLNGVPVEEAERNLTIVKENDLISIVAVPHGGDSFKDILRLVALVAVAVVAAVVGFAIGGPLGAAAAAAIMVVGSFLVNLLIPPAGLKKPKDEGTNYGYDGARNTAREGIPLPVVYGKFWVGGNYTDLFSEMQGDNQFLYGRVTLSDGQISGLFDTPYLGELPIRDYQDVQWGITVGSPTEAINPRFNKAKSHFQRQDELDTGQWVQYTTTGPVDQFQLNFTLPGGLIHYQKDGDRKSRSVNLEIQYAPFGTTSWVAPGNTPGPGGGGGIFQRFSGATNISGSFFDLQVQGATQTTLTPDPTTYNIQYSPTGANTWTTAGTYTDTNTSFTRQSSFVTDIDRYSNTFPAVLQDQSYYPTRNINLQLVQGDYDFQAVPISGGGTINIIGGTSQPTQVAGATGSTTWSITATTTKVLRRSYTSPTLPHARYEIRVRRTNTNESSDVDRTSDDIFLNDVAEIIHSKVAQRNVATGWYVARMTDQLQGVPSIQWPVLGVLVDIYDRDGNVTVNQWSDNPADIVLDMLISDARGPLKGKIDIDWPAFVDWRNHCNTEGFAFNGVFDTMESLWDQMMNVFKVGRAVPVRVGTKLSVAIDRVSQPVMLFGPGNIFKDSFHIQYLPLQDRATEFEVSYYDVADRNKKKTIRIADPDAAQAGQIPKTVAYDLIGIDNFDQAQQEVWYQLYNNRLIRRIVTFDAPVEAIGLTIGDVALVQHDLMQWGEAGRVKHATSGTVVQLDKFVDIEAGKTYKLLVQHDKIAKTTGTSITHISGNTYNLSGLSTNLPLVEELKRIETNTGAEAAVEYFNYTGTTSATVTLDRTITGTTFTIWDVDVVEERTVTTGVGNTDTITVSFGFSDIPADYANYMFGEQLIVKRPYRLTGITGDAIDRRTLTFGEYNDFVYSPPEQVIPSPTQQPPKVPVHVYGLTVNVSPIRTPSGQATAIVSWLSDNIYRYAGADVYISVDNGDYLFYQTVQNTNQLMITANDGEYLSIKVVAFNDSQIRANINTAPHVEVQVNTAAATLEEPTGLAWSLQYIGFDAEGIVSWVAGVPTGTIPNISPVHRVQIKYEGDVNWLDKGTTNELSLEIKQVPAGDHIVRVRAENSTGAISNWVPLLFTVTPPTLVAPTFVTNNSAVDHDINTDGSVNLNIEWLWGGNEADIDGFQIIVFQNGSNVNYTLGNSPGQEVYYNTSSDKRIFWFYGVPADKWYTIYVRAYRLVHPSFAAGGILYSVANKPSLSNEDPYQPESNVAFGGDITGTIGGVPIDDFLNGLGDTSPPVVPSGLSLASSTEVLPTGEKWTKLLATWSPSSDSDLLGYILAIKEDVGSYIEYVVDKGTTAFFWSVLPNTDYTVKLAAYDTSNNRSPFGTPVTHTTVADTIPPAEPTGLTGTAAITSIFLSWTNPADADVLNTEIWENDINDNSTATRIATVNAVPNLQGRFTRSGLATGVTKYYWVKARDRSGNTSIFSTGISVTTAQVGTADIAANAITAAQIAAGTITADRIMAGTITGDRFDIGTSLPGSITVGSTGVSLSTIADGGGSVNSGTTQILPGKVLISGSITLADWRYGGDLTKIEGGNIAANTISANKIYIGARGLDIEGITFEGNRQTVGSSTPNTNYVAWTAGTISYVDDTGLPVVVSVSAGFTQWTTNLVYLYWTKGGTTVNATTVSATAYAANNVVLATYNGGTNLVATYGRTAIDGSLITTDTINANRLKAGTVIADTVLVGTVPAGTVASWADVTDATYIDGGKIFTGSITATQLSTSSLITTSAQIGTATIQTLNIAGSQIIVPVVEEGSDFTVNSGSLQDIMTSSTITVGDAVDGKTFVTIYGWADIGSSTFDAAAQIELHYSKNGGAYTFGKSVKIGVRSDSGTSTYSYMPFSISLVVTGAQTVAIKIKGKEVLLPGQGALRPVIIREPVIVFQGAKR